MASPCRYSQPHGLVRFGVRIALHALALLTTIAITGAQPSAAATADNTCERVAAPGGSDSAPGTEERPYRTAQRLINSLAPGQDGCLRAGTYDESVTVTASGRYREPITLRSFPGERATIFGRLYIPRGTEWVRFRFLSLNGLGAPVLGRYAPEEREPSPVINGDDIAFLDNEVTNEHTAICFMVGHPDYGTSQRVRIRRNRIHDCGVLPATNHDHGIYLESRCCTQVTDNWIYDNADRGIQLYPNSDGNYIARNVIDGNGEGINFGGSDEDGDCTASDANLVERNIISNSRLRDNVESWWGCSLTGHDNVVRENCIWPNTISGSGFRLEANASFDPLYADRPGGDFRLGRTSRCLPVTGDVSEMIAMVDRLPWVVPAEDADLGPQAP